jgi:hypothetical protein
VLAQSSHQAARVDLVQGGNAVLAQIRRQAAFAAAGVPRGELVGDERLDPGAARLAASGSP